MSKFVYEVVEGAARLIEFDVAQSSDTVLVKGADDGFISIGSISHKMQHGVALIPKGSLPEGMSSPYFITEGGRIAMDPIKVNDGVAKPDTEAILIRISRDLSSLIKRVQSDEGRIALLDGAVFRTTLF